MHSAFEFNAHLCIDHVRSIAIRFGHRFGKLTCRRIFRVSTNNLGPRNRLPRPGDASQVRTSPCRWMWCPVRFSTDGWRICIVFPRPMQGSRPPGVDKSQLPSSSSAIDRSISLCSDARGLVSLSFQGTIATWHLVHVAKLIQSFGCLRQGGSFTKTYFELASNCLLAMNSDIPRIPTGRWIIGQTRCLMLTCCLLI